MVSDNRRQHRKFIFTIPFCQTPNQNQPIQSNSQPKTCYATEYRTNKYVMTPVPDILYKVTTFLPLKWLTRPLLMKLHSLSEQTLLSLKMFVQSGVMAPTTSAGYKRQSWKISLSHSWAVLVFTPAGSYSKQHEYKGKHQGTIRITWQGVGVELQQGKEAEANSTHPIIWLSIAPK